MLAALTIFAFFAMAGAASAACSGVTSNPHDVSISFASVGDKVSICLTDDHAVWGLYPSLGIASNYNAPIGNSTGTQGHELFSYADYVYTTSKATYKLHPVKGAASFGADEVQVTLQSRSASGTDSMNLYSSSACTESGSGCGGGQFPGTTDTLFLISVTSLPAVAAPTVTSISPSSGTTAGGTSVTIAGTGFNGTTGAGGVRFGSTNATTYAVDSDIQITATAPAGTGTVDVTVTNNSQTSATSSADHFTYVAPPVLGVSMTHSGNATQGAAFAYTITPSTTVSATSAATVTAAFSLPVGMTYSSASGTNWSCSGSGQSGSCTTTTPFGTGNGPTITLNVAVAPASPVSVNASVTLSGGGASNSPTATDPTTVNQVPASVTITAGNGQSATVNNAFATALQVTVTDAASVVINNASVTFTAPASGASGTFATGGTNAQTVSSNASGIATASTFTANGTAGGPYTVSAKSGSATASFSLTNTAAAPTATSTTTTASSVAYDSIGNSITVSGNISGTTTGYSVVSGTTSGGGTVSIDATGVATYTP